jgi:hypothetical protein
VLLIDNQADFGLTGDFIMQNLMERAEVFRGELDRLCWRFMIMHLNGKDLLQVMTKLNNGLDRHKPRFSFGENNCIGYKKNPRKNFNSEMKKVKMSRELQKYLIRKGLGQRDGDYKLINLELIVQKLKNYSTHEGPGVQEIDSIAFRDVTTSDLEKIRKIWFFFTIIHNYTFFESETFTDNFLETENNQNQHYPKIQFKDENINGNHTEIFQNLEKALSFILNNFFENEFLINNVFWLLVRVFGLKIKCMDLFFPS